MDKKLKLSLILEAQKELVNNPQNSIHDITHHYRVLQNALNIVKAENLENSINSDLLEIICWWHDVKVSGVENNTDKRVTEITTEYLTNKLPEEYRKDTADAILNHEWGMKPNSIIGKILQDADKLEFLSTERIDMAVESVLAGTLDTDYALNALKILKESWIPRLLEMYNYNYSKAQHKLLVEEALKRINEAFFIIEGEINSKEILSQK